MRGQGVRSNIRSGVIFCPLSPPKDPVIQERVKEDKGCRYKHSYSSKIQMKWLSSAHEGIPARWWYSHTNSIVSHWASSALAWHTFVATWRPPASHERAVAPLTLLDRCWKYRPHTWAPSLLRTRSGVLDHFHRAQVLHVAWSRRWQWQPAHHLFLFTPCHRVTHVVFGTGCFEQELAGIKLTASSLMKGWEIMAQSAPVTCTYCW